MGFLELMALARVAVNAAGEFRDAYAQIKDSLSPEDEVQLRAEMDKLRAANDELYESVQAKLRRAASETGRPPAD